MVNHHEKTPFGIICFTFSKHLHSKSKVITPPRLFISRKESYILDRAGDDFLSLDPSWGTKYRKQGIWGFLQKSKTVPGSGSVLWGRIFLTYDIQILLIFTLCIDRRVCIYIYIDTYRHVYTFTSLYLHVCVHLAYYKHQPNFPFHPRFFRMETPKNIHPYFKSNFLPFPFTPLHFQSSLKLTAKANSKLVAKGDNQIFSFLGVSAQFSWDELLISFRERVTL